MTRSSEWSCPARVSDQYFMYIHLSHMCYIPCLSHPPWLNHPLCNVTSCFLWWKVVGPLPNPQTGQLPFVSCLWLLIQYTCSFCPYLEDVCSKPRRHHAVVVGTYLFLK
jgi:hypothetical protein